jgi:imidazolonepropionase-like amidohydrolase
VCRSSSQRAASGARKRYLIGARPYWIDDSLLGETFTQAEIKALENPRTPRDAPQTWATGSVPRSVKRLKAAGLRFALGTDMGGGLSLEHDPTPSYLGWSSHIEMESMVKAGLTPSEVITAATRNSAQILGLDQLGRVASGMDGGNPQRTGADRSGTATRV